jgi:hypothetical protein
MLTHKTGDVSDIAALELGADYLLAWVDERSSDPEVYATKVNHALNRIAPEQRITQAPGSATDLSLVQTANGALLVWADARDAEAPGSADIYAAALRAGDVARIAPEVCVQKTRAHSFAPEARSYGKNTLVAWLESAAETGNDEPAHISFAQLDEAAHLVDSVQSVTFASGTPVTLGLECNGTSCHAIVSVDDNAHNLLYAVSFQDGKASSAVQIRSGLGVPSSVAPVLHGREVYVADTQQGRSHLRRLLLDW